jgi:tRNA-specific 2-thiouridylase
MSKKALVAMSGGVDSSVALLLMKQKGFECTGAMMKLFDIDGASISPSMSCGAQKNFEDAEKVAKAVGANFEIFDFRPDFRKQVIDRFVKAYTDGATPNPCIECNRYLKFDKLYACASQMEMEHFATGHYARIEHDDKTGRYLLKKAKDETKDQSYVLYSLSQDQLAHTIFPLGDLQKTQVREIAAKHNLLSANKRESQDICFIQDGDYAGFIEKYAKRAFDSGNFIDTQGNKLGRHNGLERYTVGQRKGLGISLNKPMYVQSKNIQDNTITLCEDSELYTKEMEISDANWITYEKVENPIRAKVKIRYAHTPGWATITPTSQNTANIKFDEPQRAIAKGQGAVMYDGDVVLGGGTIC